jgi:two-component system, OmpR family, sensor kinase
MKSIRRYLLLSLILALSVGTLLVALFLYKKSAQEINELYDSNMKALAAVISTQLDISAPKNSSIVPDHNHAHQQAIVEEEEFLIQVWNKTGEVVYTTHPLIKFPRQTNREFFTIYHEQQKWRVLALESDQIYR